jgi:cardiolipin synthase
VGLYSRVRDMDWHFIVNIIFIINIFFAIVVVFFERKTPTAVLAWLMVLFFLPLFGFLLYLFFGQNFTRRKMFTIKGKDDLRVLQEIFEEQYRDLVDPEYRFSNPDAELYRDTILALLRNGYAFLTEHNRVEIFTDGKEKFDSLFEAIGAAQHHIHMEYFIVNNDELGRAVVHALAGKASEGVEVRLLFDALGTRAGKGSKEVFHELTDAGGKIGVFFPSIYRANYRNHRKIAVIDGKVGFIGGFNIGDEYLGKGPLGYWRDTALRIQGRAVNTLQLRFMLDWNFTTNEFQESDPAYFPEPDESGATPIQIVSSGPDLRWSPIKEGYIKLINSARESVYIQTPYFIPDDSVSDALRLAAFSGVDVRVMIPCKPDHPFVYWASLSFIGDLLGAGVRAYTYDNGFIHAKTIVVDGKAGSVGSANWDERSFRLNFETNAFFYDASVGSELKRRFEQDLTVSTEITPERYAERPAWIKFKESISRLFSGLG